MQENNVNAKCPHCGAELYLGYNQGSGLCMVCRKQFDNAQAIKLYESLHKDDEQKEEKKKASFGEEYLEVDRILTRADYYFERKNFEKAKEELQKGFEITNSDYRLYFGMVRVETKNLTDYRNTSHEEFLNKAIECADADQKKEIMRCYKNFYQLSKLTDEEILQYKQEENVAIKKNLEEKFKNLIPFFMKKERSVKINLLLAPIFAVLLIALSVLGWIYQISLLLVLAVVFAALTYLMLRNYFASKRANKLFNALLDIYDALDSFDLDVYTYREVLDKMKSLRKAFEQKNNNNNCEDELAILCNLLCTNATETARRFVVSHPLLNTFTATITQE